MAPRQLAPALIALGILAAGVVAYEYEHAIPGDTVARQVSAAPTSVDKAQDTVPDFSSIVQRYGSAVVNISTTGVVKIDAAQLFRDDPSLQFFRGFPPNTAMEVPVHGQGSGFIVNPDGLIVTNAHVVANASEVTVKLIDQREFRAKVLGSDSASDIAVLRINAKNLPTVRFGNPADVRPGEWVVAIGSPFGFENSVTAGIVSAKRRALPGERYVPFIQSDAPVNPGSSGGPLFNMAGEVIGINSQIFSASGGYEGVAFAIPIDVATRVEKQIVSTGHATYAELGVTIQEMRQPLAQSFGLNKAEGALVSSVARASAAARAGLESGDVILKANGQRIVDSGDLSQLVAKSSPGDRMTLEIWRNGKRHELIAILVPTSL